jgi:MarR family transcriptional regulator for hemolysin
MPLAPTDARARFAPLVAHVSREWRRAMDGRLQAYGLTEATWLPLLRIARSEAPMRQNELAASLSLDGSSVVRLLDALENSGLVERCEDMADRRAKSLVLTPRGRRTVDQVERVSQDIRDLVLGEVSDEDLMQSLRLLETVRDRLGSLAAAEPDQRKRTAGRWNSSADARFLRSGSSACSPSVGRSACTSSCQRCRRPPKIFMRRRSPWK